MVPEIGRGAGTYHGFILPAGRLGFLVEAMQYVDGFLKSGDAA